MFVLVVAFIWPASPLMGLTYHFVTLEMEITLYVILSLKEIKLHPLPTIIAFGLIADLIT